MARSMATVSQEELAGNSRLEQPGKYHFIVEDIQDGKEVNGDFLPGLFVKLRVLEGEHESETINLSMLDGKANSKDGGRFALVKQCAFLVAANVLTPQQVNGGNVEFDEQSARGAQIVAELSPRKDKPEYLDFHFSNIYHVDDPRAADVPKCQASLAIIPQQFRHDASYFASMVPQKKAKSAAKNGPAQPAAAPKDSDFADIS